MTPPLRVMVITDHRAAAPRTIIQVAEAALAAGAPAIQLRSKHSTPRELLELARELSLLTAPAGALLVVDDRFDVALAAQADGVHLGPVDLPVALVRGAAPPGFLIGASTDDPGEARSLEADGASYIGCGAVYPTANKADAGDVIGTGGLGAVVRSVSIPVIGIGGITVDRAAEVAATGAAGCAVIGAVMGAEDPGEAVRLLLAAFD